MNCNVLVGNVGVVFRGPIREARQEYLAWVAKSVGGIGAAAWESVTMCDEESGDPLLVHLSDRDASL